MKKQNLKKIKELFDVANKVFPIEQGVLPSIPHHAIIMDAQYGLTLNLFLQDKQCFAQTCLDREDFNWNNMEEELVNLWTLIHQKEKT